MKLLLDTHALVWWLLDDPALGSTALSSIKDQGNEVLVSAVSAMEVTTKVRLGKFPEAEMLARHFSIVTQAEGFLPLEITIDHAQRAGSLPIPHKDPFDRMLIAQAQIEGLTLVSNEAVFDAFEVTRLW